MSEELQPQQLEQEEQASINQPDGLERDAVRAHMVAAAINSEPSPLDAHTFYGAMPERATTRQQSAEFVQAFSDGSIKGRDRFAQEDIARAAHEHSRLWKDQDAFIKNRTEYYDSLYAANPEKFASMSVEDFLETAKKEKALYAEIDKQESELGLIADALDGIDAMEEEYNRLITVDVTSLDAEQLVAYGNALGELARVFRNAKQLSFGNGLDKTLNYHAQTAGPGWGLPQKEVDRRKAWHDYTNKYGVKVDRFIQGLQKPDALALSPVELIAKVRKFAENLFNEQQTVTKQSVDAYNHTLAGIKGGDAPEAA